jgi:hypothetical protein
VLQLPAHTTDDFDKFIPIEDRLIDKLGKNHEVDGHDFGSGTMNFFVYTNQPKVAFETSREIFAEKGLLGKLKAAYREEDSEDFTVLWPENYEGEFDYI